MELKGIDQGGWERFEKACRVCPPCNGRGPCWGECQPLILFVDYGHFGQSDEPYSLGAMFKALSGF